MVSAELKPDQPHCRSLTEAHDFMREPQPGDVYMYVQSPTGSQRWDMCYAVKSVTGWEPQTEASGGCVPGNRPGRFSQIVRLHNPQVVYTPRPRNPAEFSRELASAGNRRHCRKKGPGLQVEVQRTCQEKE